MNKSILLLLFTLIEIHGLSITVPNEKLKRGVLYGDLSYSYSATDVGAEGGGHVKTVTVIKNISKGKHDYKDSDGDKNIKLIVKWPEIPSDVFSTLEFSSYPSAASTPKIVDEKEAETNKTESNIEVMETPMEDVKAAEEEEKMIIPEKQMEQMIDVPKKDVELLEPSQPIGLNAAIKSAKAQAHAQYLKSRIDNAVAMGDIAKLSNYSQKLRAPLVEDFSDFSMHNIRHLNNPKSQQKEISVKIIKREPYIAPSLRSKIPK